MTTKRTVAPGSTNEVLTAECRAFRFNLLRIGRLIPSERYKRACVELAAAEDLLANGSLAEAGLRYISARGAVLGMSAEEYSAIAEKSGPTRAEVRAANARKRTSDRLAKGTEAT